jgi:hypothetical protein
MRLDHAINRNQQVTVAQLDTLAARQVATAADVANLAATLNL